MREIKTPKPGMSYLYYDSSRSDFSDAFLCVSQEEAHKMSPKSDFPNDKNTMFYGVSFAMHKNNWLNLSIGTPWRCSKIGKDRIFKLTEEEITLIKLGGVENVEYPNKRS